MDQYPGLLETDELQDVLTSLELVGEALPRSMSYVSYWKWVIIGLHNALQGFMVLALKGSDSLRVLTEKSAREWMEAYEKGDGSYPELKLDWFPNLYEKITSDLMKMYSHSKPFEPSENQDESVRKFNDLRNGFVHFIPKILVQDVSEFPSMVFDVINIIDFLGFESGNVLWIDDDLKSKARAYVSIIRSEATALKSYYGV